MIKGIGIDIIELERIKQTISKESFINRILTVNEKEQLTQLTQENRRVEYVAGRFAAKEAFAKATGTGIGKLSFQDIEVLNNALGAPVITVKKYQEYKIHISISHSNAYAIAQVVMEE